MPEAAHKRGRNAPSLGRCAIRQGFGTIRDTPRDGVGVGHAVVSHLNPEVRLEAGCVSCVRHKSPCVSLLPLGETQIPLCLTGGHVPGRVHWRQAHSHVNGIRVLSYALGIASAYAPEATAFRQLRAAGGLRSCDRIEPIASDEEAGEQARRSRRGIGQWRSIAAADGTGGG